MSIDIVVTNYHTPGDLEEFCESLERFPPTVSATLTVIEVDSEPYEHQFRWAGGHRGRTLGVVGNCGYARACNLGASIGVSQVIALFNADVVLTEGAIDQCYEALIIRPQWGALGPRQVDDAGHITHAGIFGTLASPAHRGWWSRDVGQFNDVCEAVTVSGAAYFVKRRLWNEMSECPIYRSVAPDATGAFLPTPHYYEETWCSYHLQSHGHRVGYYGPVGIVHKWHRASPPGGWADQQMAASRKLFRNACDVHGIDHD